MKKLIGFSAKFMNEKGIAIVYVAMLIAVFLGLAAFVVDIGYQRVVRNQLQNAADAAALAACNMLYDRDAVMILPAPPPDWTAASNAVLTNQTTADGRTIPRAISINSADNKILSSATIVYGWWDITKPYEPDQWQSPPSSSSPPPSADYGPAVRVTIDKVTGENDGPIMSYFAGIFGINSRDVGATATAVAASPGSVRPDAVVPVALAKEVADKSTDYDDPDHLITIGSPYMYPNSLAGQWTSFFTDNNDSTTMRDLMNDGNPAELSIGDAIWIEPGVKATLYDNTQQASIQSNYAGRDVVFPIVDAVISDTTHSEVPIAGFIGFHIVCAGKFCGAGASEEIIMGYFITAPAYGGPVGPNYGPLDRCRLCR